MDSSVITALVTAGAGIIIAAMTYYFTKRHEFEIQQQKDKINHYKVLLSALSDLAMDDTDKEEANKRFALAVNTIALIANQDVITALMKFHDEIKFSNPNKSAERHDELLKVLLLAIRKDIKLSVKDNKNSFIFHLIGTKPSKGNTDNK